MYTTTPQAVDSRNLVYIAVFGLGAVVGLAVFVNILRYFLHNHRWWTPLIMAGLMLGSLRALWPWQSAAEVGSDGEPHGAGGLLAPTIRCSDRSSSPPSVPSSSSSSSSSSRVSPDGGTRSQAREFDVE